MEALRTYLAYPFVQYAIIAGLMIALSSSLLGVTLVLKRFSLIGDGLSHVAFGALAVATVLRFHAPMVLVLPITILCAIALLCASQGARIRGDASIAMLSVGSLAIGYLLLNLFGSSSNLSGDVCTTLFGSTSILTLSPMDVWCCALLSLAVVAFFILFYERIFAITFDETFSSAVGVRSRQCNLVLAMVVAVIIVLAMNLVGSLLISALIVFPALAAMRLCTSFFGVTICASVISIICALSGLLTAILAGTPVGSTIVAADMTAFLLCAAVGLLIPRIKARRTAMTAALCMLLLCGASCGGKKAEVPAKEEESQPQEKLAADLDLTQVNPMMIYMQVFYMIQKPHDYAEMSIRLPGTCTIMEDTRTHERIYYCNVTDSTGCCAKMIPFRLKDASATMPSNGSAIVVYGHFRLTEKDQKTIGVLCDAVLE